jgi:regulatory protein YycI of two-component signal transduction system YycFG
MRKVNLQVIRPWVAKKVVELVGFEDEVLIEYAMGLLEDESQPVNTNRLISSLSPIDIVFRHQTLKRCKST